MQDDRPALRAGQGGGEGGALSFTWMDVVRAQHPGAGGGDEGLPPTQCHLDGISAMEVRTHAVGTYRYLVTCAVVRLLGTSHAMWLLPCRH